MNCNLPYWKTQLNGLSAEWEILGHVGNPSPTQKAIFFFLDKDSVRAVAKIPLSVQAKAAILNEAAILRRVKAQYIVPEVLFTDEEHGVVAQSWMQGRHISRRFREEHLDFLLGLGCNGCTIRLSDFRNALATQLSCFDRPKTEMQGIEQALSLLENDEELMAFIEHRDFAPWNIRLLADGKITLIDWEWAVENSLPWQDICRYFYIQDYLFNESKNVWDILTSNALLQTYARKCRLSKETLRGLTSYYLLRTFFEDWTEGQHKRCAYTLRQIQFLLGS
ncbi:MAG TPA: aminoglycoside phosphotransferase family protein [Pseudacidobacterium sp.]|nr:aminoglycoside phosphotransferase family protein [Pseudacidobacterium sp.]